MFSPRQGTTRDRLNPRSRVVDHHRNATAYQHLNKQAAIWITDHVGTMTCAWIFCLIAIMSLPATLVAARVIPASSIVPSVLASTGFILVVSWIAQSFIQLVLLPALMVGQTLQNAASDARASQTFEDIQKIIDSLDPSTPGGLQVVMTAIKEQK